MNTKFLVTRKRNHSDENLALLRNSSENETWDDVFTSNDCATDRYKIFRDIFLYHLNIAFPLVNKKNGWITTGIRKIGRNSERGRRDL